PTLEGNSRIEFIQCFLKNAPQEYQLDEAFIRPVAESFQKWSVAPAESPGQAGRPVVTNFGAYLYSIRADLQSLFPHLYGRHRIDFANWFIHAAALEYEVGREQILPGVLSWTEAGPQLPEEDSASGRPLKESAQEMLEIG